MSTDTIKQIAAGLITIPSRPVHHEALLDTALFSAVAFYSALHPLMLCALAADTPGSGSDEQGDYAEFAAVPLTSGIMAATALMIAGEQYKFRIAGATAAAATVRVYTPSAIAGATTLEIWRPAAHAISAATWPAHHEAIIAMITASFYLNAVSLTCADYRYAEMLQAVASSYFGRAQATLQS